MNACATIVLADDEPGIREALSFGLEQAGFRVIACPDGQAAVQAMERTLPDLAILDIMMPRLDGLGVLRYIRSRSADLPVLFLSSRDGEFDRVLGLELGADDYVCKPFSLRELVARVRVLLRRSPAQPGKAPATSIPSGGLSFDAERLCASWRGETLPLTVSEFRILYALAERPGVVFSRDMILAVAWPDERFVNDRAADGHIKRIRRKLADFGLAEAIETVYGAGYRLSSLPC